MNDEKFPASLEKVFEQLDDYLDYCNAVKPFYVEEIRADLKRRGIDTAPTTEKIRELLDLAKTRHQSRSTSENKSTAKQFVSDAAEWVADKIDKVKRYCDLGFYVPQFVAVGNLAGASPVEADKPREIMLTKEFTESELSRIPWAGPKVKLSKTIDAKKGTAIYHAFVTSVHPAAPKSGVLRIVLITPDGQTAQARLKSNARKKMFEGVELPADSSELRYALFIE
jgi:hypothetical protein